MPPAANTTLSYTADPAAGAVVLLVDDNERNRKLIEAYLYPLQLRVENAAGGVEALEYLDRLLPDLVLLDVMMPDIDGFDVCRRIKESPRTQFLPVILVTALDDQESRLRGIEAGADDFLTKPVNRVELLARIRALLRTKRLIDQVQHYQAALRNLFDLSGFSSRYPDHVSLLQEFSRQAVALTGMSRSLVAFREAGGKWTVVGGMNLPASKPVGSPVKGNSPEAHVVRSGEPLVVEPGDQETRTRFQLKGAYVGVPLKGFDGSTLGVISAFDDNPEFQPFWNRQEDSLQVLTILAQRLGSEIQIADNNRRLERTVAERTQDLVAAMAQLEHANSEILQAQEETIIRLALAAEYRDSDTASHIRRMALYSQIVAREAGMSDRFCDLIRLAAPMHDVGKIGIADHILRKSGPLTPDEFEQMKQHTVIGGRILANSTSALLQMSEQIALNHHEKWDGSGYPNGLRGENIPMEARVVALSDVFDALTTRRSYKAPYTLEDALTTLRSASGSHFDPGLIKAFFDAFPRILQIHEQFKDEDARPFV